MKPNEPQADVPDIRKVRDDDLARGEFPGGKNQEFRIHFAPEVHRAIWAHATETTAVEVCGVLVGRWSKDAVGPFLSVIGSIKGDAAQSKFTEVTFTHETWSKINDEMDRKYADYSIVGWYHTHPDFGIFLSERDTFIQQHFFSGPGQVAHVVDPVRKVEGVFVWKEGKPRLAPLFWVGDDLKFEPPAPDAPARAPEAAEPAYARAQASEPPPAPVGTWERALIYALLFSIGFLLANMLACQRSAWEQERLVEGVVAHYGIWRGLKPGFDERLATITAELDTMQALATELAKVPTIDPQKDTKGAKIQQAAWQKLNAGIVSAKSRLATLKSLYGLDPQSAREVEQLVLRRLTEATAPPLEAAPRPTTKSEAKGQGSASKPKG